MQNRLMELLENSLSNPKSMERLKDICNFCDSLRLRYEIEEMIDTLYTWLNEKHNVQMMLFSTYEIDRNVNCIIFNKGENFTLDHPFSFYFIINTNTELNGIISFCANDEEHYKKLNQNSIYLETLFYQATPIIQNALLRKLYLEQSSIDSVTNVYNREYLINYIHKKISLAHDSEDTITFMMIGIDRFKAVIDEFDYDIGDQVLVQLAKVIHGNIKSQDIVARLTGDEFLVAILHTDDIEKIKTKAQVIIDKFAKIEVVVNEDTNQVLKKTICIGISSYPKDAQSLDEAIKNADKFLYEAKNNARGSYAVYEKEQESKIDLF